MCILHFQANDLFTLNSASYSDGMLYCNISQPASYVINSATFDLNIESYYLFMAKGITGSSMEYLIFKIYKAKMLSLTRVFNKRYNSASH